MAEQSQPVFSFQEYVGENPSPFTVLAHLRKQDVRETSWLKIIDVYFSLAIISKENIQFSSVQSLSRVRLFVTPWIAARQASLSITSSRSLPKPMSIKLVTPSSHFILCRPLLLLPPVLPSIRVFSNESTLHKVALLKSKCQSKHKVIPFSFLGGCVQLPCS